MIYARPPTDDERSQLQRMARREVGRVSQRARLILMSARHRGVPELSALFDMSRATVRMWIHRFNAHGPIGLYDGERCGRPRKARTFSREDMKNLKTALIGQRAKC